MEILIDHSVSSSSLTKEAAPAHFPPIPTFLNLLYNLLEVFSWAY